MFPTTPFCHLERRTVTPNGAVVYQAARTKIIGDLAVIGITATVTANFWVRSIENYQRFGVGMFRSPLALLWLGTGFCTVAMIGVLRRLDRCSLMLDTSNRQATWRHRNVVGFTRTVVIDAMQIEAVELGWHTRNRIPYTGVTLLYRTGERWTIDAGKPPENIETLAIELSECFAVPLIRKPRPEGGAK